MWKIWNSRGLKLPILGKKTENMLLQRFLFPFSEDFTKYLLQCCHLLSLGVVNVIAWAESIAGTRMNNCQIFSGKKCAAFFRVPVMQEQIWNKRLSLYFFFFLRKWNWIVMVFFRRNGFEVWNVPLQPRRAISPEKNAQNICIFVFLFFDSHFHPHKFSWFST